VERAAGAFSAAARTAVLKKLTDLVEHAKAPRTQIAAARALNAFARLELDEAKLQAVQQPPPPAAYDPGPDAREALLSGNEAEKQELLKRWRENYG
jgi:hypothetical protein